MDDDHGTLLALEPFDGACEAGQIPVLGKVEGFAALCREPGKTDLPDFPDQGASQEILPAQRLRRFQ